MTVASVPACRSRGKFAAWRFHWSLLIKFGRCGLKNDANDSTSEGVHDPPQEKYRPTIHWMSHSVWVSVENSAVFFGDVELLMISGHTHTIMGE